MKPRIIVLGGCGFIGRNLVHHLITNDLVECVRVVDKVPPQIAWLNSQHQSSFDDSRVHFKSCNLINPVLQHSVVPDDVLSIPGLYPSPEEWMSEDDVGTATRMWTVPHNTISWIRSCMLNPDSCKAAFAPDESGYGFDYVVNCAGETKPGQTDPVYKEGILKLSLACATEASRQRVKHYVELSAGNVASSDKVPLKENCKKDPWTSIAKWKSQVEDVLSQVPGLNYTILRPGIVYGCGDRTGLTPRLVIGSIYKYLGECMKLLWTKDLKMNTVHVDDLCRAIWFVLSREDTKQNIYHVVDEGNSTQGSISSLVSEIFNINHDYWGTAISSIAKADLASAVEEINDKHLGPWAEICTKDGVHNTPLSPYIDKELLTNKSLHLDGDELTKLGFTYSVPKVTTDKLKEVLVDYIVMNLFPRSLIS